MPQNHIPARPPRQTLNHLMTPNPRIMIPRQPPLRHIIMIILLDMILITRKNPRPTLPQIHLQHAQSRRMSRTMMQRQSRSQFQMRAMEWHPVYVESEVVWKVDAQIGLCGYAVEGMLYFELVDVYGDAGVAEKVQAAGVVEVEMADYYHFDVFDGVPCFGDLLVEAHCCRERVGSDMRKGMRKDGGSTRIPVYTCEDVRDLGTNIFGIVCAGAGFVEDDLM